MSKQKIRVLIIDDSPEDRSSFRHFLQKSEEFAFEFLEAETGTEGVELCLRENPDCLLLDYNLPDTDGLEIIQQLNPDPQNPAFPIILLTGAGNESLAVKVIKNGAQDYLVKGKVSAEELSLTVRNAIEIVKLRNRHSLTEANLRESEARYRSLFELAAVGIAQAEGSSGKFQEVNDEFCRITGYSREELLGLEFPELTHPDDREADREIRRRLAQGNQNQTTYTKRYVRKNGQTIWVRITATLIRDADGKVEYGVSIVEDITEKRAAEEKLREVEDRRRIALEAGKMGTWEWLADSGRLNFDDYTAEIFGLQTGQLSVLDRAFFGIVVEEDVPQIRKIFLQQLPKGESASAEYRIRRGGETRWIYSTGRPVVDENGKVRRVVGVHFDITTRKLAEEALRQSESRARTRTAELESLLTAAPLGMAYFDRQHRYLRINQELAEINGIPAADHIGKTIEELMPVNAESVAPVLDRIFETGEVFSNFEITGETPREPGVIRHWLTGFFPVRDENGEIFMVGAWVAEITERKRSEEQLKIAVERNEIAQKAAGAMHYEYFPQTDKVFRADSSASIIGYPAGEVPLTGAGWQALIHPDDLQKTWEIISAGITSGAGFTVEYRVRHKNGNYFWIYDRAGVTHDPQGGVACVVGMFIDITKRKAAEERLRVYEKVILNTRDAVLITEAEPVDLPGPRILAVNQAFCEMTGYTEEEIIGQTPRLLQGAKTDRKQLDKIRRALKNWEPVRAELTNYRKDGSEFAVEFEITPVADENGWFTHWISVQRDITERKRTQEALRVSEERLTLAMTGAQIGTFDWNIKTGAIEWSDEIIKSTGYSPEKFDRSFEGFMELIYPLDREMIEMRIAEAMNTGEYECEFRLIKADGSVRWVIGKGRVFFDDAGKPARLIGVDVDITKRKIAEEQLIKSQQFTQNIVETAPTVLYTFNLKTSTPTYLTNQAATILGYSFDEIKDKQPEFFSTFMHPDDARQAVKHFKKISETVNGEAFEFEYRMRHKSGEWRWFRSRDRVFRRDADGAAEEILGIALDITERKKAEEELRSSEEFNRTVLENSPDCVKILDREGRLQFMNVNGLCLMEIDDFARYKNKCWWEFWAEETKPIVKNSVEKALVGGTTQFQAFCPTAKGTPKWWDVIVSPIFGANGKTSRLISVSRDITAQKRAEMNLAFLADLQTEFAPLATEREIMALASRKISEYFNLTRCVFVEIDDALKTGTVVHQGPASDAAALTSVFELENFHTAEEREALAAGKAIVINDIRGSIRPPAAAAAFESLGIRSLVMTSYLSQGKWKFALGAQCDKPRQWQTDERDFLSELASRIYVRLERARAERALRESEERLRLTMDAAEVSTWDWNIETGEVQWSENLESLVGLKKGEFGQTFESFMALVHPDDAGFIREKLEKAFAGDDYNVEFRMLRASGEIRWAATLGRVLRDAGGKPYRMLGIDLDITARKEAEKEREFLLEREQTARREAEAANRAKDDFLAMLSHELRSPLNAMYGWTQMLLSGNVSAEKTRQAIEVIARNIRLQNALIEDLLDVSRIISGKMQLEKEIVSLGSIIQTAIETVRPAAEKQGVKISSTFCLEEDEINGDRHRLSQIVGNLLTNSVKFTPAGGEIDVDVRRAGSYAVLRIQDNGIGIEPEVVPRIFDRFKQADASSKRKFGGLGLGLAIVKHLVELHGGTVTAHSEGAGRGATFTVSLPLLHDNSVQADVLAAKAHSLDGGNAKKSLAGLRILLVDDEQDSLDLMSFLIESNGAQTVGVPTAVEALEKMAAAKFDLLISDIGMAEMDGYDLIKRIRKNEAANGETTQMPAIALTGYVSAEDRERVRKAGFQIHLAKPFETGMLMDVIQNLLKMAND